MDAKKVNDSVTEMTEIVMPNHANTLGKLRGGKLIDWMDIAGEIAAQRHAETEAVTASITQLNFEKSISVGDIVTVKAHLTRAFNTSMEILVEVWIENKNTRGKIKTNDAIFMFVAIDGEGKTVRVPQLEPVTKREVELFNEAGKRKEKLRNKS